MLQVTDRAVAKIKQLLLAEGKEGHGLRVAVRGGGCAGFEYGLSWEEGAGENDQTLEFQGLKVFIDGMSGMYLDEVNVDYVDSLQGSGFKIGNPKATGSCGCGSSFSV